MADGRRRTKAGRSALSSTLFAHRSGTGSGTGRLWPAGARGGAARQTPLDGAGAPLNAPRDSAWASPQGPGARREAAAREGTGGCAPPPQTSAPGHAEGLLPPRAGRRVTLRCHRLGRDPTFMSAPRPTRHAAGPTLLSLHFHVVTHLSRPHQGEVR